MHKEVLQEFNKWYKNNQELIDSKPVAELGSYNINGTLNENIPHMVGFDICEGPNVNVVIEPGRIPDEHKNKYNFVISISSFQFCPDSEMYKNEILDLLCDEGLLFLTMCSPKCQLGHTTSPNKYNFEDSIRMTHDEIKTFFGKDFEILEVYDLPIIDSMSHHDTIIKAKKK
jgi:hypothetical protein